MNGCSVLLAHLNHHVSCVPICCDLHTWVSVGSYTTYLASLACTKHTGHPIGCLLLSFYISLFPPHAGLGFDVTQLMDVKQEGCTHEER